MIRKIIEIDEEKCGGCGLCIPACPEGAMLFWPAASGTISIERNKEKNSYKCNNCWDTGPNP